LGKILPNLTKLKDIHMDLSGNEIDGKGMTSFAKCLELCKSLTRFSIWLGAHQVDDKGICELM